MMKTFDVVTPALHQTQCGASVERDSEGYYVASVPELRGCHTQA